MKSGQLRLSGLYYSSFALQPPLNSFIYLRLMKQVHMVHMTRDPPMRLRKQKIQLSIIMTPQSAVQCYQSVTDNLIGKYAAFSTGGCGYRIAPPAVR